MTKSLGVRIGFLLFVLLTFSNMALAVGGSTFRLLLQDFQTAGGTPGTGTGVELTITDNALKSVAYNDKNGLLGDINWFGNVGEFYVNINATSTDGGAIAGGQLSVTANVQYEGTLATGGSEQFVLSVEDSGYSFTPGSTVLVQNTVNNLSLTGNASAITTSTDLTTNTGDVPLLPANGIQGNNKSNVALTAPVSDGIGTSVAPVPPSETTGIDASLVGAQTTNLFAQANVTFGAGSGGNASFSLTASDPIDNSGGNNGGNGGNVPEPTTLMLLGSALLGLGVLRGKVQV